MLKIFFLLSMVYYSESIEFKKGLVGGDMILTKRQYEEHYIKHSHERNLAGINGADKLWKIYRNSNKFEIPWGFNFINEKSQTSSLQDSYKSMIQDAFDTVEDEVKYIKFVPYDSQIHTDFITVGQYETGCFSKVGRSGNGIQTINLHSTCISKGTTMHEILHALGFYHEHSRSDRDIYIVINNENIISDYTSNFEKQTNSESNGVSYDYGSIMHYSAYAFSKDPTSLKTIVAPEEIGQRDHLSEKDIFQLQLRNHS